MFKDGRWEFSLAFEAESPGGKHFKGKLSGVMDYNVKGACSLRKLRESLASQIGTHIVNVIEKNVRD